MFATLLYKSMAMISRVRGNLFVFTATRMGIYPYLYTETVSSKVSNVRELLQCSNDLGVKGKEGHGKREQRGGSCGEGNVLVVEALQNL